MEWDVATSWQFRGIRRNHGVYTWLLYGVYTWRFLEGGPRKPHNSLSHPV